MILLPDELRERLVANGRERNADHLPVVKFLNPLCEGVWIATKLNANGDEMFGLADLGYPELAVSRSSRLYPSGCPSAWASSATSCLLPTCRCRLGHKPPAESEAFATPNASSTRPPSLVGTAREISA